MLLQIRQIRQAGHAIEVSSRPALLRSAANLLKTPTAGHRRTPIQSASAITAEAEAGINAGTLERQNLRICNTCISANPAYLHNLRICKT